MTFLYIFPENLAREGGGTVHLLGLSKALVELGHRVVILAPRYGKCVPIPQGVEIIDISFRKRGIISFLAFQIAAVFLVPKIFFKIRPDVAIIRSCIGILGLLCAAMRLTGTMVVLEVNGAWWEEMLSHGLPKWSRTLGVIALHTQVFCTSHVVGVTQAIANEVGRLCRIWRPKCIEISNGADPSRFHPEWRDTVRRELQLEDQTLAVVLVSLFTPWHGILELIDGVSLLDKESQCQMKLFLAGDGSLCEVAQRRVHQYGLEKTIVFPGMLKPDMVARFLAAMDLGLFLSSDPRKLQFPGSPLKFFEYLAAGLPVLVSHDSYLTPIVDDGHLGMVIPKAEPQAIARALNEAIDNRDGLRRTGMRNRERSYIHYSWQASARRLLAMLLKS